MIRLRRNRFTGTWACRGKYGEVSGLPGRRGALLKYMLMRKRMRKQGAR